MGGVKRVALVLALVAVVAAALFALLRGGGELGAGGGPAERRRDRRRRLVALLARVLRETDRADLAGEGVMDYAGRRGRVEFGRAPARSSTATSFYVHGRRSPAAVGCATTTSTTIRSTSADRALRNPGNLLEFLTGAGADVRETGEATVRGVPTQHYEGTLDLQRVVDAAPAGRRAEFQQALFDLGQTAVPFGLWVGRSRAARGGCASTVTTAAALTIEFWDFGVPVALDVPTGDDVMTEEEYAKQIVQQAGKGLHVRHVRHARVGRRRHGAALVRVGDADRHRPEHEAVTVRPLRPVLLLAGGHVA